MGVEVRLLGAVDVVVDGVPANLGHARQRCVLAALAVEANDPVNYDKLVFRVWGVTPPRRPLAALYSYLHRLRQALAGAEGVELVRRSGFYQLVVDPEVVDLHRFQRLSRAARREPDDARRIELHEQALALWRGEPFAGLTTAWLDVTRVALVQHRHLAEVEHVDAALRLGRCHEVVAGLIGRAAAHPFDECVTAQLMTALHGVGRTAEAFAAYRRMCRRLAEELGTGPGEALRAAHRRLLQTPAATVTPAPVRRGVVTPVTRLPVEVTTSPAPGPRW
ncbi:DNA-binding SARP family transcriptional activator [Saccharothrix ecbatanensis]|uniref:DNA-binding SARP family transcriptional activator n=1 Tax=Saccharothrix ecbatanensis TaxID=1105145 RepID=A0A7W9HK21_9PSEU|nr:AfsR/SARP family transcriptional regulator [Saccharothrix ecbatanensis]MBB5803737.1 DNA-binding SARP family transcriptional activator [Saccharothrix ecbatanensis]